MNLVTRSQWGARSPKTRTFLVTSQQRGTAVHYTGSAAEAKSDHALCDNVVRSIQNFHMDDRGWADIAYSFLVCIHGYVFEGRGRGIRTAAQGTNDGNDAYHAVCFMGGDLPGRADVTSAGLRAIKDAVNHCNAWAGVKGVRPHSSFHSTECPGDELRAWIAKGMPTGGTTEEDDVTKEELVDVLRAGLSPGFNTVSEWAVQLNDVTRDVEGLKTQLASIEESLKTIADRISA